MPGTFVGGGTAAVPIGVTETCCSIGPKGPVLTKPRAVTTVPGGMTAPDRDPRRSTAVPSASARRRPLDHVTVARVSIACPESGSSENTPMSARRRWRCSLTLGRSSMAT